MRRALSGRSMIPMVMTSHPTEGWARRADSFWAVTSDPMHSSDMRSKIMERPLLLPRRVGRRPGRSAVWRDRGMKDVLPTWRESGVEGYDLVRVVVGTKAALAGEHISDAQSTNAAMSSWDAVILILSIMNCWSS